MRVAIRKLHSGAVVPTYGTPGAAAFDLYACEDALVGHSGDAATLVNTGVAFAVPEGYVMLVYARSGLASKYGMRPANCVGVIDPDYRGAVKVPLVSDHPTLTGWLVEAGDRIAQAMIVPAPRVVFDRELPLTETARGTGGFGSTDTSEGGDPD